MKFEYIISVIIVSKYIVPKGYTGLALFPFVFVKSKLHKNNSVLINHERIHLRQQLELLILPFYIIYVLEFLFRWMQYKNWYTAYRNISFEREAYENEKDLEYIKTRPSFNFREYY